MSALAIETAGGVQVSAFAPPCAVISHTGPERQRTEPSQRSTGPDLNQVRPPGGILLVAIVSAISGAIMGCLFGGFLTVALTMFLSVPLGIAVGLWAARLAG